MSKAYPCVHWNAGKCKHFSDERTTSWCIESPCEAQVMSNADRIRTMSDEELAERDVKIILDIMDALGVVNVGDEKEAIGNVLKWLKQPEEVG